MRVPVGVATCRIDPSDGHPLPRPTRSLAVVPRAARRHRIAAPGPELVRFLQCSGRPRRGPSRLRPEVLERRDEPMKLTTNTQISVDGVVQANGARNEEFDPGMERGGWARPLFDSEAMAFVNDFYQRAHAFLFGRRTYELFAGYWGVQSGNPIADALNSRPKYVASNTLTDTPWADTTVLSGEVAAAIRELKAKPGGELQVHGSGNLVRWLIENELVDEINLLVCPVIVGQGTRLFPDAGPDTALELVDSRAYPKGITLQDYRPAGRPENAT